MIEKKLSTAFAAACGAALLTAAAAIPAANAHPVVGAAPAGAQTAVHLAGHRYSEGRRYYRRRGDTVAVDAPTTRVWTRRGHVEVEAPFTYVRRDHSGVRVRAPFVDLWVPYHR
ncbi:MAG: hypothetical protein AB7E80_05645 [Hyphomicrobiaceae bacterium]